MQKTMIAALVAACGFLFTQNAQAQFSAGAGFQFGTYAEKVGLQLRGMYQFDENWRASGDLVFYLDNSRYYQFFEFNTNAHYIFLNEEKAQVYGLAGINMFRYKYAGDYYYYGYNRTRAGLNIGIGGQYFLTEQLSLQSELKYAISSYNSLGITLGAAYLFGERE